MNDSTFDRVFRSSGVLFVVLFIVSYLIRGAQPEIGASADTLAAFYGDDRGRILIGTFLLAFNLLNLLWFAAALSRDLRDAGQGIWASAATAASAVLGGVFLVVLAASAAVAYPPAGSGSETLMSTLNDLAGAAGVLIWLPVAMLIMAGTFGLWQAKAISNAVFVVGVVVVVAGVVGATTWASDGIWAPDGAYARVILPIAALAWIAILSAVLTSRAPSPVRIPESAAVTPTPTPVR
jgi:hypothetical protein